MVFLTPTLLAFVALSSAAPIKRIAQVIADSTAQWEQACLNAGGADQCNPVSITAFTTLLAAAGPCDQQNAADQMIDLAKTLNNDASMINFAQIFAQQPRNSPTSQSVPYCQTAPANTELDGLFQCQFQSDDPTTFVGGVAVGGAGTIPFGLSAPLSPAGSCKANPDGPIADGSQLVDITQDSGASNQASTSSSTDTGIVSSILVSSESSTSTKIVVATSISTTSSAPAATSASTGSSSFQLQNGIDAQKLNAQFASFTADSSCTDGENACVGDDFAQCVNGKFVTSTCGSGLVCKALPLVNSAGTSITCTTEADAETRIAATGATGGVTGGSSSSAGSSESTSASNSSSAPSPAASTVAEASTSNSSGFLKQNGEDAIALNAKFASLTADSSCNDGDEACVDGGFAQCVNGAFVVTQCAATLTCQALPLVNSAGTSITCTTTADAATRIAATGA